MMSPFILRCFSFSLTIEKARNHKSGVDKLQRLLVVTSRNWHTIISESAIKIISKGNVNIAV